MADITWVVDGVSQFVKSPMWTTPVNNFIDDNCTIFDTESEMKFEYTAKHNEFQSIIDNLLTTYITELGVPEDATIEAIKASADPEHKELIDWLLYLDDFVSFKKMMERRNVELEVEAMRALERMNVNIKAQGVNDKQRDARGEAMAKAKAKEDAELKKAIAESRKHAEMIMKQAELEDLELQQALALSLALESERVAKETTAREETAQSEARYAQAEKEKAQQAEEVAAASPKSQTLQQLEEQNLAERRQKMAEAQKKVSDLFSDAQQQSAPADKPPALPAEPTESNEVKEKPTHSEQTSVEKVTAPSVSQAPREREGHNQSDTAAPFISKNLPNDTDSKENSRRSSHHHYHHKDKKENEHKHADKHDSSDSKITAEQQKVPEGISTSDSQQGASGTKGASKPHASEAKVVPASNKRGASDSKTGVAVERQEASETRTESAARVSSNKPQLAPELQYDPSQPSIVRVNGAGIARDTGAPSNAPLAPIGRKEVDVSMFRNLPQLPQKSFQDLKQENTAGGSVFSQSDVTAEEFKARQAEIKRQRDLLMEQKKRQRSEELASVAPTKTSNQPPSENQRQFTLDIARRFREDIVRESQK